MLIYVLILLWLIRALLQKNFRQVPVTITAILYFGILELLHLPSLFPYATLLYYTEKILLLLFVAATFWAAWKGRNSDA